jgi:hypothetical protein
VLAENRFLAARDGMDARLIDSQARCLIPVREILDSLLADCRDPAVRLGCTGALDRVQRLAATNGAERQRALVARSGRLDHLVENLADRFLPPRLRMISPAAPSVSTPVHVWLLQRGRTVSPLRRNREAASSLCRMAVAKADPPGLETNAEWLAPICSFWRTRVPVSPFHSSCMDS